MPSRDEMSLVVPDDRRRRPRNVTLPSGRVVQWSSSRGLRRYELKLWPRLVEQAARCAA